MIVNNYTNDIVYRRLAPGVLAELKQQNPTLPGGRGRSTHHHRLFTPDFGHPKLKEHLAAVTALMRASPNWETFKRHIDHAFPLPFQQTSFLLPEDDD